MDSASNCWDYRCVCHYTWLREGLSALLEWLELLPCKRTAAEFASMLCLLPLASMLTSPLHWKSLYAVAQGQVRLCTFLPEKRWDTDSRGSYKVVWIKVLPNTSLLPLTNPLIYFCYIGLGSTSKINQYFKIHDGVQKSGKKKKSQIMENSWNMEPVKRPEG